MSHAYVRTIIRQWATAAFDVPFLDSINRVVSPPHDGIWSTVEFDPAATRRITFCNDFLATGLADFIFAGPPAVGDAAVIMAADRNINRIVNAPYGASLDGALALVNAQEPEELSNGSADHNYRVVVGVEYWFYFRNPPTP